MASKIKGQTMYLPIVPYKVEGSAGEEFDELSVTVNFDDRRKHFYVAVHPGWKSSWGGHGCIIMGDDNPLTAPKYVAVKDAPRNSQKTIDQMFANLELAKEDIAWLFDQRDWARLYAAVRNIAINGYTEQYRKQMEELIKANNNNTQNQKDNTMRLNINNNQNETMNVQNAAQVTNPASPAIEDAQAEEIESVAVGEVTLDSIMPVMQPVEGTEYTVKGDSGKKVTFASMAPNIGSEPAAPTKQEVAQAISEAATTGKAATMPLGSHGTLVIASGGGEKSEPKKPVTLRKKTPQPQAEVLPKVRLVVYLTSRGHEQAPRIEGFGGEDDPRWKKHYDEKQRLKALKEDADKKNEKLRKAMKGKTKDEKETMMKKWVRVPNDPFNASYFTDRTTGEKTYSLVMGAKYLDVAQQLVDAYNTNDCDLWAKAEQAVADVKSGIVAEKAAEREAERAAKKAQAAAAAPVVQPAAAPAMSAEEQAMFDLFKRFMAGDKDAMAKVGAALKAA